MNAVFYKSTHKNINGAFLSNKMMGKKAQQFGFAVKLAIAAGVLVVVALIIMYMGGNLKDMILGMF